jgi:hypothetical protein
MCQRTALPQGQGHRLNSGRSNCMRSGQGSREHLCVGELPLAAKRGIISTAGPKLRHESGRYVDGLGVSWDRPAIWT